MGNTSSNRNVECVVRENKKCRSKPVTSLALELPHASAPERENQSWLVGETLGQRDLQEDLFFFIRRIGTSMVSLL